MNGDEDVPFPISTRVMYVEDGKEYPATIVDVMGEDDYLIECGNNDVFWCSRKQVIKTKD